MSFDTETPLLGIELTCVPTHEGTGAGGTGLFIVALFGRAKVCKPLRCPELGDKLWFHNAMEENATVYKSEEAPCVPKESEVQGV